jgi:prolyl-tRNA synthetase
MRWSRLFIPTLRENPGAAGSAGHRLLLRAGYIRQLMSGHYTLLPLAVRVRARLLAIIRQEMDGIGAQEFLCPTMQPAELWKRSGRWELMGEEMFRLRDRKGADVALGMTHEEVFTALALELDSYRNLPQAWYQIQTKLRDEPRAKAGLLRTREFTMKDSYSFDLDEAGLDAAFDAHAGAYGRIYRRMDLPFVAVEASSGTMGGSTSVEFMAPCDAGEDDIVVCDSGDYAANSEKATAPVPAPPERPVSPPAEHFATPGVRTIQALAEAPHHVPAARQIKTLVHVLDGALTLVLLRGDHALEEQKLIDATGALGRPAHPDEIRQALGALPGSLGAVGVGELPVIADIALRGERDMTTGANVDDVHLRHVDVDRDVHVGRWADLRRVRPGEPCPRCGRPLRVERAIEVGHIFKLGRRYSDALGLRVPDRSGRERAVVMGSYGIGVERALAAIVEAHRDDAGIVWPVSVAPFDIAVVPLAVEHEETGRIAERLYEELRAAGLDVLLDDRPGRPGAKLTDVELIGVPYRLVVGPRSVAGGVVEFSVRRSGETTRIEVDKAGAHAATVLADAKAALSPDVARRPRSPAS